MPSRSVSGKGSTAPRRQDPSALSPPQQKQHQLIRKIPVKRSYRLSGVPQRRQFRTRSMPAESRAVFDNGHAVGPFAPSALHEVHRREAEAEGDHPGGANRPFGSSRSRVKPPVRTILLIPLIAPPLAPYGSRRAKSGPHFSISTLWTVWSAVRRECLDVDVLRAHLLSRHSKPLGELAIRLVPGGLGLVVRQKPAALGPKIFG